MNALGPVARPVFEYNHDVVMRWGGEGLARRLGVRLLGGGLGRAAPVAGSACKASSSMRSWSTSSCPGMRSASIARLAS